MDVQTGIAIAVGVGGLAGFFTKGRNTAIIRAQATLIDTRDRELADKNKQITQLTTENTALKEYNEKLIGLAQGSPQLIELTKEIKNLVIAMKKQTETR